MDGHVSLMFDNTLQNWKGWMQTSVVIRNLPLFVYKIIWKNNWWDEEHTTLDELIIGLKSSLAEFQAFQQALGLKSLLAKFQAFQQALGLKILIAKFQAFQQALGLKSLLAKFQAFQQAIGLKSPLAEFQAFQQALNTKENSPI